MRDCTKWATAPTISVWPRTSLASAARRRISRASWCRRRSSSRIAARCGAGWVRAAAPGVYVLKDADGRPLYVGKAVNLRRRLRAHFAEHRWRATKSAMTRAAGAEWREVGSELEALLREAALIDELQPEVNVQIAAPDLRARAIPPSLIRDVIVVLPSIEDDSVELIAARADGGWMIQRTRKSGADLAVHTQRLMKFFFGTRAFRSARVVRLAPLVFSWLARRGAEATRLDPHHVAGARELRARLAALLRDDRLFRERLEQC
ncbi:MAG: hypothetical protein DMG00_29635 [Acidobacteria bacterium]|nr:MAG: hypothetical protein DMG00_29635 [Acidobacteriota bacterium]